MASFDNIRRSKSFVRGSEIMADRPMRRPKRFTLKRLILILIILGGIGWGGHYAISTIKANTEFSVELEPGLDRAGIAEKIGEELGWSKKEKQVFAGTHAQIQWMAFSEEALQSFMERFRWGDLEKESFLVQATKYIEPEYDFLALLYAPGTYVIKGDQSMAEIADMLVSKTEFSETGLKEEAVLKTVELVRRDVELLPDLVPLPAKDVRIDRRGSDTLLSFSTTYYNQGKGPLELIADPATKGIRSDIARDVLQRIYRVDGGHRDRVAGNFLWHQEHLHYHFADFVIYDLEAVDVKNPPDLSGVRTKSTFCIRDVSLVDKNFSIENRVEKAKYLICGKELQGISVGWGDTYFYNYVDQNLNITDLPSGTYRLSFIANPSQKFEESSYDNNKSSVLFELDMQNFKVKILEETPKDLPAVEHIYEEQVF